MPSADQARDHSSSGIPPAVEAFLARWSPSGGGERSNYQLFLAELCDVLGVPKPDPAVADVARNAYIFDRSIPRVEPDGSTTTNFIDLYKRGCFICETKQGVEAADVRSGALPIPSPREGERVAEGRVRGLSARRGHGIRGSGAWDTAMEKARNQAEQYARALPSSEGRPPFLLIVDVGYSIELFAEFTCTGGTYVRFPDPRTHRIHLRDLREARHRETLRQIWTDPLSLDPARRSARVTRDIADHLARLACSFETQGHDAQTVAEFLMRCIFTMFAEDVRLLPDRSFKRLLESLRTNLRAFPTLVGALWKDMATGAEFSVAIREKVLHFNGGLFECATALPVTAEQLELLIEAAHADWRDVEPAIFGTLLERALSTRERHKLGAHHTPRAYVERLVFPTVIDPLRAEWETVKTAAAQLTAEADAAEAGAEELDAASAAIVQRGDAKAARAHGKKRADFLKQAAALRREATEEVRRFHHALCQLRVLDPACGSANFLYVTMEHVKRLEGEVLELLAELGDPQLETEMREFKVRPHQFIGLEINPWAVPIAELVLWIGYLQWHFRTSDKAVPDDPVISKEHSIRKQDAVLAYDRKEMVTWEMARQNPDLPGLPDDVREILRSSRGNEAPFIAERGVRNAEQDQNSRQGGRDGFHSVPALSNKNGDAVERVPTGAVPDEVREQIRHPQSEIRHGVITVWDGHTMKLHPVTGKEVPDETARVPIWRYVNPRQAEWPEADYVVGNPPYLGARTIRLALGGGYLEALRQTYPTVPENCDYVMYWWDKAAEMIHRKKVQQCGLITTKSFSQAFAQKLVGGHFERDSEFSLSYAIPNHPWVDSSDGADVRVALTVCCGKKTPGLLQQVTKETKDDNETKVELKSRYGNIQPDLTIGAELREATVLASNAGMCSVGYQLTGKGFTLAQSDQLLKNKAATSVIKPLLSARDIVQNSRNLSAIDLFGLELDEVCRRHPEIYQWILTRVKPERDVNNRRSLCERWWIFGEARSTFRPALSGLKSVIVTPLTAKHRCFVSVPATTVCDSTTVMFAFDSPYELGILSSEVHVVWALRAGGRLGVGNDPRYIKSQCFDNFPFPDPDAPTRERIRALGEQLDAHRKRQQALHPGLTLTGMYNVLEKLRALEGARLCAEHQSQHPGWEGDAAHSATHPIRRIAAAGPADTAAPLQLTAKEKEIHEQGLVSVLKQIHDDLDAAVLHAYGWDDLLNAERGMRNAEIEETILERLVALNHQRAEEEKRGIIRWLRPEFQNRSQKSEGSIQKSEVRGQEEQASPPLPMEIEESPEDEEQPVIPHSAIRIPKLAWPKALAEQVHAVSQALASAGQPLTASELAGGFQRANKERIAEILATLVTLGKARAAGKERYQA